MPSTVLRPNSTRSNAFSVTGAGGVAHTALDPGDAISHDDATSYVSSNTNTHICRVDMQTNRPVVGTVAQIVSLTANARARANVSPIALSFDVYSGGGATAGPYTCTDVASFTNNTQDVTALVTIAELEATDFGMTLIKGPGGTDADATSVWMPLTWNAIARSFGFFASAVLPFVGPALLLREMPGVAGLVLRRTGVRFLPHELRELWEEITAPRRVYACR
jgi:hypothetical protein